jgi:hypothetical protein
MRPSQHLTLFLKGFLNIRAARTLLALLRQFERQGEVNGDDVEVARLTKGPAMRNDCVKQILLT